MLRGSGRLAQALGLMQPSIPIVDMIATRDLEFLGKDGRREAVRVSIGRPVCTQPVQQEWWCPYLIEAPSFKRQHRAIGGDSMQALILSTESISADLFALARDHEGTFTYLGESDLHFPPPR